VLLDSAAVDFDLSEDQRALAEAARVLMEGEAAPDRVRAHIASGQPYDTKLWKTMADQGRMGVETPVDEGGRGLGFIEAAVLLEEAGRHLAPVPFAPSMLALWGFRQAATSGDLGTGEMERVSRWVDGLLSGETTACVAWSRDASSIRRSRGDRGWTLSGLPDPVVAAPGADLALVWTPDAVFGVELTDDLRPRAEPAMDLTRSVGWLHLDGAPAVRLGGEATSESLLDRAVVATCAEMLGGAARVLEMTAEYAKVRVQFGQPIGSFQAVKHRCADMVVDVEGMRSSTWYGAWCVSVADPDAPVASSGAKVWCSDAARRVMASGLQVHGGIGFTWEHDLHLYLKRSQLDQVSFGDASWHRERLARLLRSRVERGAPVI
jgi:alkylation response protein AidB-like acyl-CoA dehydrogenase